VVAPVCVERDRAGEATQEQRGTVADVSSGCGPRDAQDQVILTALQGDGFITRQRLARSVGLSVAAVASRMRRLERDGLVRGYRAEIEPKALGIGLHAFVAARLKRHGEADLEVFEGAVRVVPAVISCYHVAGSFDYLLRLAVHDVGHLSRLVRCELAALSDVASLETLLVLTEVKSDSGWPVFDALEE
jgi:Lrp/AsnC family transcriptional regulator, leucine-responsive regulatory protein